MLNKDRREKDGRIYKGLSGMREKRWRREEMMKSGRT